MNRQYENPPVREAVCEFRFDPSSPWNATIPGLVYAALRDDYPKLVSPPAGVAATITVGEGLAQQDVQSIATSDDLRFWRDSNEGVIRLRPHTLAVSHYRPYPSWSGFRRVITQVLDAFREVANPVGIQRIGLRYINQFEFDRALTGADAELDHYFDLGPRIGTRLRQDFATYFVGIQYFFDDERDSLRIQMQPGPARTPEMIAITLDLDYFLNQPDGVNLEAIGNWIETARQRISESFEGCLNDPLREQLDRPGG